VSNPELKDLLSELGARRALEPQDGDTIDEPKLTFEQLRPALPVRRLIPKKLSAFAAAAAAAILVIALLPMFKENLREKGIVGASCDPHLRIAHVSGAPLESRKISRADTITVHGEVNRACAMTLIRADLGSKRVELIRQTEVSQTAVSLVSSFDFTKDGDYLLVLLATPKFVDTNEGELLELLHAVGEGKECLIAGAPCELDVLKLEVGG
jgi:hypothetical protein